MGGSKALANWCVRTQGFFLGPEAAKGEYPLTTADSSIAPVEMEPTAARSVMLVSGNSLMKTARKTPYVYCTEGQAGGVRLRAAGWLGKGACGGRDLESYDDDHPGVGFGV